jgi:hypothetical protein
MQLDFKLRHAVATVPPTVPGPSRRIRPGRDAHLHLFPHPFSHPFRRPLPPMFPHPFSHQHLRGMVAPAIVVRSS